MRVMNAIETNNAPAVASVLGSCCAHVMLATNLASPELDLASVTLDLSPID